MYHLANKIKETEVNTEIDGYLPAIHDVLDGLDREELIKKIVSVEFTRFYNYYSKTKDLNTSEPSKERSERRDSGGGSVRYFINIGERDGYDWMSLKDFLSDTLNLEKEDVFNVDTKGSFSFFNTDASLTESILQTFTDFKMKGRFINVEVSTKPGSGSGKKRNRGDRRSKFKKGGGDRSYSKKGKKGGRGRSKGGKHPGFFSLILY